MPWLVVLGRGTWIRRAPSGKLERWHAGVHEVNEETADAAQQAFHRGQTSLVIMETQPRLPEGSEGKPLTLDDIVQTRSWGVSLEAEQEEKPTLEDIGRYDYRCRMCPPPKDGDAPVAFASRGRLKRHVDFHHV